MYVLATGGSRVDNWTIKISKSFDREMKLLKHKSYDEFEYIFVSGWVAGGV